MQSDLERGFASDMNYGTYMNAKFVRNGCAAFSRTDQRMRSNKPSQSVITSGGGRPIVKSAAAERREKENSEYEQLACLLPLPSAITAPMDKASTIRLTTSYLHLRLMFPHGITSRVNNGHIAQAQAQAQALPQLHEMSAHMMQCLDGFVFVVSEHGRIMYISETASVHVGLSQVDMTGENLIEYVHSDDQTELSRVLNAQVPYTTAASLPVNGEVELERHFSLRLKCVLAKRNAGLTDQGYKVVHCCGYLKLRRVPCVSGSQHEVTLHNQGLMAIAYTLPSTSVTELRLNRSMFMFRTDMALKLLFIDTPKNELLGYALCDLVQVSLYTLIHPDDTHILAHAHKTVRHCHQSTSKYYRLVSQDMNSICWVQTHFILLHLNRSASRTSCILALTHVISELASEGALCVPAVGYVPSMNVCATSAHAPLQLSPISGTGIDHNNHLHYETL